MDPTPARPLSLVAVSALMVCAAAAWSWANQAMWLGVCALAVVALCQWRGLFALARMATTVLVIASWIATVLAIQKSPELPPVVACLAAALCAAALQFAHLREPLQRWHEHDWHLSASADQVSLAEALRKALRAPPEDQRPFADAAIARLAQTTAQDMPEGVNERRALLINVYNVLVMHAARGRKSDAFDAVFDTFRTRYRMFGSALSPDEVEHGLLRGNRPPPGAWWRSLGPRDPRIAWCVPLDYRVHFALNCGAASCPPIRVYAAEQLNEQLEVAEQAFVGSETQVTGTQARTSRILKWYKHDFPKPLTQYVARVLNQKEISAIEFAPYQWKKQG